MAQLILNEAELHELLTGPTGPVYRVTRAFAEAVVEYVQVNGPLGFDQGGHRTIGLLRADMSVRDHHADPAGLTFVVGTDPANPVDGYHYARVVHQGRSGFRSKKGLMKFVTRDGTSRRERSVGPAEAQPFLYEAIEAANIAAGIEPVFILVKTPD